MSDNDQSTEKKQLGFVEATVDGSGEGRQDNGDRSRQSDGYEADSDLIDKGERPIVSTINEETNAAQVNVSSASSSVAHELRQEETESAPDTSSTSGASKWEENFKKLKRFKEVHGHCLVPNRYASDPQLGAWGKNV